MREGLKHSSDVHDSNGAEGRINLPYEEMVERLGEPNQCDLMDDYKSDVQWGIVTDDGLGFVVWNYKNGPNYNSGEGTIEDIDEFSIGFSRNHDPEASRDLVRSVFGDSLEVR